MEKQSLHTQFPSHRRALRGTVCCVAENGLTDESHVHANLVGASRMQITANECALRTLIQYLV